MRKKMATNLIALTSAFSATSTQAAPPPQGVAELYEDLGTTSVLLGGGTAHVYDLSAVDANPAGLALGQAQPGYFAAGEVRWSKQNLLVEEAGLVDTATSEVAGGLKARRTTGATGRRMNRFSLGLAERIGPSPFIVGLGGDWDAHEKPKTPEEKKNAWRLRSGLIYQASSDFLVGLRTSGWFDETERPREHAAGVSWNAGSLALINADVVFSDRKVTRYVVGATVAPKAWLDVLFGYGYELGAQVHEGAASIAVKSEKFRLFYTVVKPNLNGSELRHSVGATANLLAMEQK